MAPGEDWKTWSTLPSNTSTGKYVDRFNHHWLHGEVGMLPPAEFEAAYYPQAMPARLTVSHTPRALHPSDWQLPAMIRQTDGSLESPLRHRSSANRAGSITAQANV